MKLKLVAILIFAALSASIAMAEDLKVGIIDIRPWGYKEGSGKISGQHIEMFNSLSQRVEMNFEYSLLPLARIKSYLESGNIDMTVIFRREGMRSYVEFVGLVMPYNYYLVGKKGVVFDEKNLKSIRTVGCTIGEEDVVKKSFTEKYQSEARLVSVPSYGSLLKMLDIGRIDAACIPSKGLKAYLNEIGANESLISSLFVISHEEAYLKFSKKSEHYKPEIIKKLREGLESMREDGTIAKIAAKYQEIKN